LQTGKFEQSQLTDFQEDFYAPSEYQEYLELDKEQDTGMKQKSTIALKKDD